MNASPDSLQAMAATANLSVPTVRYWAELHGDLLGIRRTPTGEWRFTDIAVAFFHTLGAMGPSPSSAAEDAPANAHDDDAHDRAFPGATSRDQVFPYEASPDDVSHDESLLYESEPGEFRLDELHHTDDRIHELDDEHDRLHDIAIHMSHLWEETKQMQRLLSRIIELLTPTLEKTVPANDPAHLSEAHAVEARTIEAPAIDETRQTGDASPAVRPWRPRQL